MKWSQNPERTGIGRRRVGIMDSYRAVMGDKCSWPDCGEWGNDVHHIVPRSRGGVDDVKNYILLCSTHHRTFHLHSRSDELEIEVATYKHLAELHRFGFVIENWETFKEARRECEKLNSPTEEEAA